MIKFENVQVSGWEAALRGMRNPKNSWGKSDTTFFDSDSGGVHGCCDGVLMNPSELMQVGNNDHDLAMRLAKGGPCHAKYRRMMVVYVDITAPLYWWKEFDTYRFGCEKDSCSTMHCIADHEFTLDDISHEHLDHDEECMCWNNEKFSSMDVLDLVLRSLNYWRGEYLKADDIVKAFEKDMTDTINDIGKQLEYHRQKARRYHCWWQMIQLLPSSYNQKRTVMMSYEVLANIYHNGRRNHKLDEWREFCQWSEGLPYSEFFTLEGGTSRD